MIVQHQNFELLGKPIFEKAVITPPFRIIADMPNEACFYYVIRGSAQTYTPHGLLPTSTEEGIVLQCGTYFNEYLIQPDHNNCEAIAVHFYPEILKKIYDNDFPDFMQQVEKVQPLRYEIVKASTLLRKYIDNLLFYFQHPELVSEELLKIKLKELILLLAKTDNAQAIQQLLASMFSRKEIVFKQFIEAHVFSRLSINELAVMAHQSLSSFKREFAKHYDCPPARYFRQRRLEQAAKLLRSTDNRISDIAFDCGFLDLAHFSKTFQKRYGMPPSTYR